MRKLVILGLLCFLPITTYAVEYSIELSRASSESVSIADGLGISTGNYSACVYALWVGSAPDVNSNYGLISHNSGGISMDVQYNGTGAVMRLRSIRTNYSADNQTYYEVNLDDDQWHLICQTYNGTDLKLWLDGSEVSTVASSLSAGTPEGPSHKIGSFSGGDNTWSGYIDDSRVFSTAITSGNMATIIADPCSALTGETGYWRFTQNANDETVNNYDLTENNTPTYGTNVVDTCEGGGEPVASSTTSTTTPEYLGNITFGIAILIFFQAMMFLGLVFKDRGYD